MDGNLNLFQLLGKRMDWLGQRQKVLSDNIANADTPEFIPRDLNETEFRRVLRSRLAPVAPLTTDPAHMTAAAVRGGPARETRRREVYEAAPSGNAVVLEEQLINVAETQSSYQLMTNLYRKHMELFRLALRGGG